MSEDLLNYKLLKDYIESGKSHPRVHGNGFIQVDMTHNIRMHFWNHPSIPRQKTLTPIHDHVFGFRSKVLKGRLVNIDYIFETEMTPRFKFYKAIVRKDCDTILKSTGIEGDVCPTRTTVIHPGQSYEIEPFRFHESFPAEPTVTLIKKDGPTTAQGSSFTPTVLVPVGKEPDNEFSRYDCATVDWLWTIIKDILEA